MLLSEQTLRHPLPVLRLAGGEAAPALSASDIEQSLSLELRQHVEPRYVLFTHWIGAVAVHQGANRQDSDEENDHNEARRAVGIVKRANQAVPNNVVDIEDPDRTEEKNGSCHSGIIPSASAHIHGDAVAYDLEETEEHRRQPQPDRLREDDGRDVEAVCPYRVDQHNALHIQGVYLVSSQSVPLRA